MADTRVYFQMERLTHINVSGSEMSYFPRHVFLARNLDVVDISSTRICTLPWLGNPRTVKADECATSANWSGVGIDNLRHEWVRAMTQLVRIDLSFNALTEIPTLDFPRLTFMDLQRNRLEDASANVERLHYSRTIVANANLILM